MHALSICIAAFSYRAGVSTCSEKALGDLVTDLGLAIMARDDAREQHQGIAQRLDFVGLESVLGHAV